MKFITKNSTHSTLHIGYKEKYIEETMNTKYLGLLIGNHINSKNHTEWLIPKFCAACYAIMSMVHTRNINTQINLLRILAFYNRILNSFWGESSNRGKIFTLQKKIIRILAGTQHKTFCRSLFKQLEILPVPCQYILLLMNFIINNQDILQTN
jgi:hypothetical protein